LNASLENLPFLALIDDDEHSADLLMRTLLAHQSPEVRWYGGPRGGMDKLVSVLGDINADWPSMLIVDLKMHSRANVEFVGSVQALARQKGIPIVVMAPATTNPDCDALKACGASQIFYRHADRDAYRREAASIVSFWARNQRLDAVGM